MNNLSARAKFAHGVGDPIIKTSAHRQNHIGVMHCHVGFIKTVHAQHSQKLSIRAGVRAQTHEGIGDRVVEFLGQSGQQVAALALNNATTGVNNRSFGRQ